MLGLGIGSMCVGGIIIAVSLSNTPSYGGAITGFVFIGVGEILTIVSIPVSAVAGGRKRAIKNDFAREYFGTDGYTYQPTLNFGVTQSGIGISFNF